MSFRNSFLFSLCVLSLFLAASAWAQDKQLSNVKTFADISVYIRQEMSKHDPGVLGPKETSRVFAGIVIPAGERLLEIAQDDSEKRSAYSMKLNGLQHLVMAEEAGAEQRLEAFLNELGTHESPSIRDFASAFRFNQFHTKVLTTKASPENFEKLKAELKTLLNQQTSAASNIRVASLGIEIAERNKVPAGQVIAELVEYVQSPECTLSEEDKKEVVLSLEGLFYLALGNDPKLYGKTLDDKDFDWKKLRGKYVLVKFTATWCVFCRGQIPDMLESYEKYHDKGLEVVEVYMWEREPDPVGTVKKFVEEQKLPWTIISEDLSKKAKHPEYEGAYNIRGVPTVVLVNKEGKVIVQATHENEWKDKLAEIFK